MTQPHPALNVYSQCKPSCKPTHSNASWKTRSQSYGERPRKTAIRLQFQRATDHIPCVSDVQARRNNYTEQNCTNQRTTPN